MGHMNSVGPQIFFFLKQAEIKSLVWTFIGPQWYDQILVIFDEFWPKFRSQGKPQLKLIKIIILIFLDLYSF